MRVSSFYRMLVTVYKTKRYDYKNDVNVNFSCCENLEPVIDLNLHRLDDDDDDDDDNNNLTCTQTHIYKCKKW
jgi:hypothetical protein